MLLAGEDLVGNPGVTSCQRHYNYSTADKLQPLTVRQPASVAQAIYELKDSVESHGLSTDGPIKASNAYFAPSALASVISRNTSAIFRTKSAGESRSPCSSRAPSYSCLATIFTVFSSPSDCNLARL
jgi:hypothetical protein